MAVQRRAKAELEAAEAHGDRDARYEAALRLAVASATLEDRELAISSAALVRAEVQTRGDSVARCLLAPIPTEADDARSSKAMQQIQQQLDAARRGGVNWCVALLQAARGKVLDRVVRVDDAIEAFQDALNRFEAEEDASSVASVQSSLAWLYARMGDSPQALARAIEYGQAAVEAAEALNLRSLTAVARHNLAGPLMRSDRFDEAHGHLIRALALARDVEESVGGAYIARLLARVEVRRDRPQEALALFRQAQVVFASNRDDYMQLVCRIGAMLALSKLGYWTELERELAASQPLLQSVNDRQSVAEHHRLTMQLKEARGDLAGALAASKAWVNALQALHGEQNRRAEAEARERHESARKEAENVRLRDQQDAAVTRQRLLWLTLGLALALLAVLLMHGVRQRRLRTELRLLAERDDLTLLPNRRVMLDHAQRCLEEARRLARPAAVAVLDLDHFKSVNDRYGHEVGDEALRAFGRVCVRCLRSEDRIGRIGGEEFLGVFPGATPQDLTTIFDRLRAALRDTPIAGMAADERLTFSMGAAFGHEADKVDTLTRRADQALYEAKAQGRDRLRMAA